MTLAELGLTPTQHAEAPAKRCGATIEKDWPGHRAVLWRKQCKAWPLKGFTHCRHHLTLDERERLRTEAHP